VNASDHMPLTHCVITLHIIIIIIIIIIIGIQPLGRFWAETRAQSVDWYGSGTLHPGQVLRGSLPLLPPHCTYLHGNYIVLYVTVKTESESMQQ